jgi:hypothetical protein
MRKDVRKKIVATTLMLLAASFSFAADAVFQRVQMADKKGRQSKAVLTLSDSQKTVDVRPVKGDAVSIPDAQILSAAYSITRKHRVNETSIILAPIGVGLIMMLTRATNHWLEIHYTDQDAAKVTVIRMDKHEYLAILNAFHAHTGVDVQVLGDTYQKRKR